MIIRLTVAFILLGCSCEVCGQDKAGSGRAVSFDGVDDYVALGNIYDNLELPLTISAWIFLDPGGLGTIFTSQDNSHIYNGFHFYVIHTAIIIEYGDGLGTFSADFRRGKAGPVDNIFGKWVHVAAIMRGALDMDLFLNGVNIGGNYIGTSQFPMNSSSPLENAMIGFRSGTGLTYHFQGMMDELRIWNRPLSEDEIRDQMCRKLTGDEPGLIGYWDFNEPSGVVVTDRSPNHFDGVLRGSPQRVFSGAPIGDKSVSLYTDDWHESVLTMHDSLDNVRVTNVTGDPNGLHIYEVNKLPSQTGGLNLRTFKQPYFGVFVASDDQDNFFDVNYTFNDSAVCQLLTRTDNSVSSWSKGATTLPHVFQRKEFIKQLRDTTVKIDLGPDESPCVFTPRRLNPLRDTTGFEFFWQNGSRVSKFEVTDFGTYWLTVDDGCNTASDTLRISRVVVDDLQIPDVITPNGDLFNQFFEIDQRMVGGSVVVYNRWGKEVYHSSNYQNDWDGADLPSGVYFYRLNGGYCIDEKRGMLSIVR